MPYAAPLSPTLRPVFLAAALLAARAARAQTAPAPPPTSGPACVRTLPPSVLTRVPVFVYAEVTDSADRAARPAVDLVADALAQRLRAVVGRPDTLVGADADTSLRQTALDGGLRVVARRGRGAEWRVTGADGGDSAGVRLLDRAMRTATDSGDYFIADELLRGDSLVFRLAYTHPVPDTPGGRLQPVTVRNPAPVFTLPVATERQAAVQGVLPLRYPAELQRGGFEGKVIVAFIIDPTGRAEAGTFRDVYPEVGASLAPNLRGAYSLFLGAVREAVLRARFSPGEIGGCRVRQLVQLPVSFTVSR